MRRGNESNESNDGRRTHAGGLTVRRVPNPPLRGQVLCHEVRHAGTHICFGRGDAHRTTSVQGCGAVPGLLPKGRAQRQSGRGVSDHARERRLSQRDVTWGVLALVRTHTCPDLIARSGLVSLGESVQNQATGMPEPLGGTKVLFPPNIAQNQF